MNGKSQAGGTEREGSSVNIMRQGAMWVPSNAKQYGASAEPSKGMLEGVNWAKGPAGICAGTQGEKEKELSVKTRKRNKTKYQHFSQIPKFPYGWKRKYPANSMQQPLVRKDLMIRQVCEPTWAIHLCWMFFQRTRLSLIQCGQKKVYFPPLLFVHPSIYSSIHPSIYPSIHEFVHSYN